MTMGTLNPWRMQTNDVECCYYVDNVHVVVVEQETPDVAEAVAAVAIEAEKFPR